MDHVVNMGKPRDMMQRKTLARVDDVTRRNRVASARESIYEKGYAVNSAPVEHLLKKDSLVPTAVRVLSSLLSGPVSQAMAFCFRTHFQANWLNLDFASMACSL
jgi:hypothetical protein